MGFYPRAGDKNHSQKVDFSNFYPQEFTNCAHALWRVSTAYPEDLHRFINKDIGFCHYCLLELPPSQL